MLVYFGRFKDTCLFKIANIDKAAPLVSDIDCDKEAVQIIKKSEGKKVRFTNDSCELVLFSESYNSMSPM